MADDVVIEDPVGTSVTNPTATVCEARAPSRTSTTPTSPPTSLRITCEETFPSSDPTEVAHIFVFDSKFDNGITSSVRGVFTLPTASTTPT